MQAVRIGLVTQAFRHERACNGNRLCGRARRESWCIPLTARAGYAGTQNQRTRRDARPEVGKSGGRAYKRTPANLAGRRALNPSTNDQNDAP